MSITIFNTFNLFTFQNQRSTTFVFITHEEETGCFESHFQEDNQLLVLSTQASCSELFCYWFVCPGAQFHNMWPAFGYKHHECALAQTHLLTHTCTARSSSSISYTLDDRCFQACWQQMRKLFLVVPKWRLIKPQQHHCCIVTFFNYSHSVLTFLLSLFILFKCINADSSFAKPIKHQFSSIAAEENISLEGIWLNTQTQNPFWGHLWDAALLVIARQSRSPDLPGPAWPWQSSSIRSSAFRSTDTWSPKQLVSVKEEKTEERC